MNDPLANLLARSFGEHLAGAVQPRLPARFEPVAPLSGEVTPVRVDDRAVPGSPSAVQRVESSPASPASAIVPVERREAPPLPVAPPPAWGQPPIIGSEMRSIPTSYSDAPAPSSPDRGPSEANGERTAPAGIARFVDLRGLPEPTSVVDQLRLPEVAAVLPAMPPAPAISFQPASAPDTPREPPVAPATRHPVAPTPVIARKPVAPTHPPRITVTIGRVEVRAVPTPSSPSRSRLQPHVPVRIAVWPFRPTPSSPSRSRLQPPTPKLSLDEYLRRREGGTR